MSFKFFDPAVKPLGSGGELFTGKRCLVTGASGGIGFGLAKELLRRGAEVWMCSRTEAKLNKALESLSEYSGRVFGRVVDVRCESELKGFADTMANGGPIDYLFANAGVSIKMPFMDSDRAMWDVVMETNFFGVVYADRAVIPHMLKRGQGHVVNMSSLEGYVPGAFHTGYCASKYAILGMSESLRYELELKGIDVSVICPGAVNTDIFRRGADYSLVEGFGAPEYAIGIDEAAREILAGVEEKRHIICVTDHAREAWDGMRLQPEAMDALLREKAKTTLDEIRSWNVYDY